MNPISGNRTQLEGCSNSDNSLNVSPIVLFIKWFGLGLVNFFKSHSQKDTDFQKIRFFGRSFYKDFAW